MLSLLRCYHTVPFAIACIHFYIYCIIRKDIRQKLSDSERFYNCFKVHNICCVSVKECIITLSCFLCDLKCVYFYGMVLVCKKAQTWAHVLESARGLVFSLFFKYLNCVCLVARQPIKHGFTKSRPYWPNVCLQYFQLQNIFHLVTTVYCSLYETNTMIMPTILLSYICMYMDTQEDNRFPTFCN